MHGDVFIDDGMLVIVEKIRTGEVVAEGVAMVVGDERVFSVRRSDSHSPTGLYYRQRVSPNEVRLFRVTILE